MYTYIKSVLDIIVSGIALIIIAPVFLIFMVLLKFSGEGEIFYFQKRIGFKNKYFDIWKFATMLKNSPDIGTGMITLRNDPRVTPAGHILRKTKLNELPQLINVVKGEVSLVGPRPLVQQSFDSYPQEVQDKVYQIKPGITGIGSIVFRDEEALLTEHKDNPKEFYNSKIAPYKGALELWYQDKQSFFTDLKLLILTIWVILFPTSNLVYNWFPDLPKRTF